MAYIYTSPLTVEDICQKLHTIPKAARFYSESLASRESTSQMDINTPITSPYKASRRRRQLLTTLNYYKPTNISRKFKAM